MSTIIAPYETIPYAELSREEKRACDTFALVNALSDVRDAAINLTIKRNQARADLASAQNALIDAKLLFDKMQIAQASREVNTRRSILDQYIALASSLHGLNNSISTSLRTVA